MLFGSTKMARSLKDHEEVCQERMKNIEAKFDKIDTKIDEIRHEIDGFKTFLVKIAIKSAVGILSLVCAAVFVVKL
jgi:hypothetical protein